MKKQTYELKVEPKLFADVVDGKKDFAVCELDDRAFRVGDNVLLCEYDTDKGDYTGQEIFSPIKYIQRIEDVANGYVVLGLCPSVIRPQSRHIKNKKEEESRLEALELLEKDNASYEESEE